MARALFGLTVVLACCDVASSRSLLAPNTKALDAQMDKLQDEIKEVSKNLAMPDMDADIVALRERLNQLKNQNDDLRARFSQAERTDERMRKAIQAVVQEEVEKIIQSKEEHHRGVVTDIATEAAKILKDELAKQDNATKSDGELLDEAKEDEAERDALKNVLADQARAKLRGGGKDGDKDADELEDGEENREEEGDGPADVEEDMEEDDELRDGKKGE